MTEGNEFHPPKIYAIWVDARPESPMAGLSGFLSENSRRLFFTERGDAELKIRDMDNLQLEPAEFELIRYPQRGVCLYRCGNERYLLEVHAPPYKEKLFGTAGGR